MTQISEESPTQPADIDLGETGLDESKWRIGRADDTLMLTFTVYTLLVPQNKRHLAELVKDELRNNTRNKKSDSTFLCYSQINMICSDFGFYNIAGFFGHFREIGHKTSIQT
jgi:hypothetical protein